MFLFIRSWLCFVINNDRSIIHITTLLLHFVLCTKWKEKSGLIVFMRITYSVPVVGCGAVGVTYDVIWRIRTPYCLVFMWHTWDTESFAKIKNCSIGKYLFLPNLIKCSPPAYIRSFIRLNHLSKHFPDLRRHLVYSLLEHWQRMFRWRKLSFELIFHFRGQKEVARC